MLKEPEIKSRFLLIKFNSVYFPVLLFLWLWQAFKWKPTYNANQIKECFQKFFCNMLLQLISFNLNLAFKHHSYKPWVNLSISHLFITTFNKCLFNGDDMKGTSLANIGDGNYIDMVWKPYKIWHKEHVKWFLYKYLECWSAILRKSSYIELW